MSEQQETAPACLGLVNALKNSLQDLAKQINAVSYVYFYTQDLKDLL